MSRVATKGTPLVGAFAPSTVGFDISELRLLGDNVLVLLDLHTEQVSAGGLHLVQPKYADTKTAVWGTVRSAAPGSELKAGDRVLVEHALAGDAVQLENREHRLIHETSILAVDE